MQFVEHTTNMHAYIHTYVHMQCYIYVAVNVRSCRGATPYFYVGKGMAVNVNIKANSIFTPIYG